MAHVEAFSDGVFAFAVTLLVLGIRIPRMDDPDASTGLQHLLVQQWPSYVAFALTFTVVGTVWANHRLAFSHFVRTWRYARRAGHLPQPDLVVWRLPGAADITGSHRTEATRAHAHVDGRPGSVWRVRRTRLV